MEREQAEKKFYEKCFIPEVNNWTTSAIEQYGKEYESVEKLLLMHSKQFLKTLAKLQEKNDSTISVISFSMLWTSLIAGATPYLLIEAYEGLPFFTDSIVAQKIPAPWIYPNWRELTDSIHSRCGDMALGNYIRYPEIKSKTIEVARDILVSYTMMFKGHLRTLPQSEEWEMVRKDEIFFIMAGEYMEKQMPILGIRPEVDLVYLEEGDEAQFASFKDCQYKDHHFKKLNLNDTVFEHCFFQEVIFDECALCDSRFIDCTFEGCQFANLSLMGAEFLSTRLTDTKLTNIWSKTGQSAKPEDCISCGETRFLYCLLERISFDKCEMESVMLVDCQLIDIQSTDSNLCEELNTQVLESEE